MDFGSYSDLPVRLAVDLVNTEDVVEDVDRLADLDAVHRFIEDHELTEDLHKVRGEGDVRRLHALRSRLREIFSAGEDAAAAALVNRLLVDYHAVPRVSWHGGPLHLHFESRNADFVDWLGASTAMGLAVVLCEGGVSRLGICASPRCDDVFVDATKNACKRYCDDACARRASVQAFRARKRVS